MKRIACLLLCGACAVGRRGEDHGQGAPPPDGARVITGSATGLSAACQAAQAGALEKIARLKALPAPRPLEAALTLFDDASALLDDTGGRAAIADNSHPDEAMRTAAQECEKLLDKVSTALSLDPELYQALAALDASAADQPTQHYLARVLRDFRRSGVDRDEATRAQVKQLSEELTKTGLEFGQNIRDDVRSIAIRPAQADGLPADWLAAHPPDAAGKLKVTTNTPDYQPFMAYAKDVRAREQLWKAFRQRAHPKNLEVLLRLVQGRTALARLLGYPSWAAYTTETRMIGTPEAASEFIEKISAASKARMEQDYAALLARKRTDVPGAAQVDPWESTYYEERVKAEQYAFDSQAVRPYFEYGRVKQGVFDLTGRMFGLTYVRAKDAPVWHPDIEAYDVFEGSALRGRFYLDMHPRPNKYKHAAKWTLTSGASGKRLPEAVLMCNFPKEGGLLQHGDVSTFFHEFGHLLHEILGGRGQWAGEAGTRTQRDFVEAPSQLLEEWTRSLEPLQTFARHYQTGQPIPAGLVSQLQRADEFGRGLQVRQQMFYAATSLELYRRDAAGMDTTALARELQERYTPFKYANDTYFQLSFGHLDGYSAAYYTYMWSLVIAKDLFTVFARDGLLNPAPALAYRRAVLEPGGSKDAAVLVHDFLGRDFSFDAYAAWLNGPAPQIQNLSAR